MSRHLGNRVPVRTPERFRCGKGIMIILLFLAAIILWAIMRAAWALLAGLFFMLAVGIIHHEWLPQLPTLGYWWSTLIALLIGSALVPPAVNGSSKD